MGVVNQKAELLTAIGVGLSEGPQAAKTTSHLKRRLTLALLLATAAITVGAERASAGQPRLAGALRFTQ